MERFRLADLTLQQLSDAMRLTVGQPPDATLAEVLERMKTTAETLVTEYAEAAPESVAHQATIQVCIYLYDNPATALNNAPQQNALRHSGALSLLSSWHISPGVTA